MRKHRSAAVAILAVLTVLTLTPVVTATAASAQSPNTCEVATTYNSAQICFVVNGPNRSTYVNNFTVSVRNLTPNTGAAYYVVISGPGPGAGAFWESQITATAWYNSQTWWVGQTVWATFGVSRALTAGTYCARVSIYGEWDAFRPICHTVSS